MRRWLYILALAALQFWLVTNWGKPLIWFITNATPALHFAFGSLPGLQRFSTISQAAVSCIALSIPTVILTFHLANKERLAESSSALLFIVWAGLLIYAAGFGLKLFARTLPIDVLSAFFSVIRPVAAMGGFFLLFGVLAVELARNVPASRMLTCFVAAGIVLSAIVTVLHFRSSSLDQAAAFSAARGSQKEQTYDEYCASTAVVELKARAPVPGGLRIKGIGPIIFPANDESDYYRKKGPTWLLQQGVPFIEAETRHSPNDGSYTLQKMTLGDDGKLRPLTSMAQIEAPYELVLDGKQRPNDFFAWSMVVKEMKTGVVLAHAVGAFGSLNGKSRYCPLIGNSMDLAAIVAYALGAGDADTLAQVGAYKATLQ